MFHACEVSALLQTVLTHRSISSFHSTGFSRKVGANISVNLSKISEWFQNLRAGVPRSLGAA